MVFKVVIKNMSKGAFKSYIKIRKVYRLTLINCYIPIKRVVESWTKIMHKLHRDVEGLFSFYLRIKY